MVTGGVAAGEVFRGDLPARRFGVLTGEAFFLEPAAGGAGGSVLGFLRCGPVGEPMRKWKAGPIWPMVVWRACPCALVLGDRVASP